MRSSECRFNESKLLVWDVDAALMATRLLVEYNRHSVQIKVGAQLIHCVFGELRSAGIRYSLKKVGTALIFIMGLSNS